MTRILTGMVLGILLVLALAGGALYFTLFVMLIVLFSAIEFSNIFFRGHLIALKTVVIFFSLTFPLNLYARLSGLFSVRETFIIATLFVLAPILFMLSRGAVKDFIISVPMAIIGPLWVGYLISYTVAIYYIRIENLHYGLQLIFLLAFLVTGNDIGAYYIGKAFGKTSLSPVYSPLKTWEGAFGGLAMALFNGTIVHFFFAPLLPLHHILILAVLVVVAGSYGDLFASVFKRSCNVKDAGGILPGHGGLLDRLDSFAFATPVFYWYLYFTVLS